MLHEAGTEQPLSAVICNSVFLIILVVSWLFAVLVSGLGFFFFFFFILLFQLDDPGRSYLSPQLVSRLKNVYVSVLGTATSGVCSVFHNLEIRLWNCIDSLCATYTKLFKLF